MPYDVVSSPIARARMVQGSASPLAGNSRQGNGKPVPAGGTERPEPVREAPPPPKVDLTRAVESLERFMRETSRNLRIDYDGVSRRSIITVIDGETGEVVRQIPPDELLNLARRLAESTTPPALFDGRA